MCAQEVQSALTTIAGIESCDVNHVTQVAKVKLKPEAASSEAAVREALAETDFKVLKVVPHS